MKFNLAYLKYKLVLEKLKPIEERKPWLNQKALAWLNEYVKKEWRVLEFGGGGSTLYFSDKCLEVHTVETDKEWREKISDNLERNNHKFVSNPVGKYDLILIDSSGDRLKEFEQAKKHSVENRVIVFDNFDRYKNQIKEQPQLLFTDYACDNAGITTTAVFLR